MEEFQSYGDIEELPRYLKKALTLDGRLQKAVEIIDQFNEEERAYGFEESNYPLRKQASNNRFFQVFFFRLIHVNILCRSAIN